MSDDLVNQITLNFLISKQQLQKLNKKIKQKEEDKMKTDMEIYKEQESSDNEDEEQEISANDEEEISANDEEQEIISASNNKAKIKPEPQSSTIYKKAKKNTQSKGVDNIEQLPLDWFTKVRQTQKQHTIIPRKSDGKK